jgi:transposase InsO family protein
MDHPYTNRAYWLYYFLKRSRGHGGKRRRVRPGLSLRRSASRPDEVWSYDFIQDRTADGGTVRILSIIDEYTRECLLLKAARSFPARRVIDALEEIMVCSGRKPQYIRSDNGPEFVAKSVQKWLGQAQVGPRYIERTCCRNCRWRLAGPWFLSRSQKTGTVVPSGFGTR